MPRQDSPADRAINEAVGRRMKLRRSILSLTQEQVAAHLGITFQQVQKYERGANRLSAGSLYHLSLLFNVPIGYFFEDLHEAPDTEAAAADEAGLTGSRMDVTRQGMRLLRAFTRLKDAKTRTRIADLVDELSREKE